MLYEVNENNLVCNIFLTGLSSYISGCELEQFEGTTLNGIYFTANYIDAWFRPMAKKIRERNGIKVRFQVLVGPQMRKTRILAGKDPQLDLVMLQMDNRGGKLTAAGHLEDLEPYLRFLVDPIEL